MILLLIMQIFMTGQKEKALYFSTFKGTLDLPCAPGSTGYLAGPELGAA